MTDKQKKALAALLTASTVNAAAQTAEVGYSTLRRWLKEDDAFRRAYQEALAALLEDAAVQAKMSLSPALSTLREIVEDQSSAVPVRVQAARALLDYGLKLTEIMDVLERLEALEERGR